MVDSLADMEAEYGALFDEAYEAVRQGKVKKYSFTPSGRVRWIVVGRHRDYLILPRAGHCTCEDFFFRVLSHEKPMCYHLLAQKIAVQTGKYDVIEEDDSWYMRLMREWLPQPTGKPKNNNQ
jgi:predicted nucleic acid-binding Zn finger protein